MKKEGREGEKEERREGFLHYVTEKERKSKPFIIL